MIVASCRSTLGWWLVGGGGLADTVIDDSMGQWSVIDGYPTPEEAT